MPAGGRNATNQEKAGVWLSSEEDLVHSVRQRTVQVMHGAGRIWGWDLHVLAGSWG